MVLLCSCSTNAPTNLCSSLNIPGLIPSWGARRGPNLSLLIFSSRVVERVFRSIGALRRNRTLDDAVDAAFGGARHAVECKVLVEAELSGAIEAAKAVVDLAAPGNLDVPAGVETAGQFGINGEKVAAKACRSKEPLRCRKRLLQVDTEEAKGRVVDPTKGREGSHANGVGGAIREGGSAVGQCTSCDSGDNESEFKHGEIVKENEG
ncbi:hypothetical protein C8R43DRAFT_1047898 [Mycena crocata]|nr:hypothetical protein C8R43DRAFT_1047898 [Mycena crocata]